MSNKPREFEDDGRTVADMSGIERQPMFLPKFKHLKKEEQNENANQSDKPWEDNSFSKKERKSFIFGALGAGLLIGAVFALAFALIIFLFMFAGK